MPTQVGDSGLEIRDLLECAEFRNRALHAREVQLQLDCLRSMVRLFATDPEQIFQELVEAAASLCRADSAGISLEDRDGEGKPVFRWAATTGEYSKFLNLMLPRASVPCDVCVATMRPQLLRVSRAFLESVGVYGAAPITDGMLLPWGTDGVRGTIWVLAHTRTEAFDAFDHQIMETLADFAMIAVRAGVQQQALANSAKASEAVATAHELAHRINNPLQSMSNCLYLAARTTSSEYVHQATADLRALSTAVQDLLRAVRGAEPKRSEKSPRD